MIYKYTIILEHLYIHPLLNSMVTFLKEHNTLILENRSLFFVELKHCIVRIIIIIQFQVG